MAVFRYFECISYFFICFVISRSPVQVRPVAPRAEIISAFYFFFTTLPNDSVGRSCERIRQLQNLRKHGVFAGFSFSEMNFKTQYATKNLTLFYKVRFCSLIRFFVQDHLLTIYECTAFPPSKFPIVFATLSCMESVAIL